MRFALLLLATHLAAAALPTDAEKDIRARAEQFYTLLVAKKFRDSEPFVIPSDRDNYYAMQKPLIYDFAIKKVVFDDTQKIATLEMESTTKVRRPIVGEMTIPLSYESHWREVEGTWFWYIPDQEVRDTPFGKMVFSKKDAILQNGEELKRKMAEGPSTGALLGGVKADKTALMVGHDIGNSATATLANMLPGPVHLVLAKTRNPLLTVELTQTDLGKGEHTTLVVKRSGAGAIHREQIIVKVEPTQQQIAIQVQ